MYNNSETTKARNLKFRDMLSLDMKLSTCILGGARLRGLGKEPETCDPKNFLFLKNGLNLLVKAL